MNYWQALDSTIFLLVFARCAGALLLLPPWNWRDVPVTVRLGLAAVVTLAVTPLLGPPPVASPQFVTLFTGILYELCVGLSIGFLGALIFWGLLLAGQIIERYIGGSAGAGLSGEEVGPIAQLYYLLALVVFIIIGGHRWLVQQLYQSFLAVPIGGVVAAEPIRASITAAAGQMFLSGLLIAAPAITALFLADVVLAMLSRAMPTISWAPAIPALRWPVALVALLVTLPLLGEFVRWQFTTMQTSLSAFVSNL